MADLNDFIDQVVGGQATTAREQLQSMIGAKTADALDARKQEISSALFNNGEEQEVENEDGEEIEASADEPEAELDDSEIEYEEEPTEEKWKI